MSDSAVERLIAAALAVRQDVRGAGNVNNWACLYEEQAACERRLSELDAALCDLGVDLPRLFEGCATIPPAAGVEA